MLRAATPLLVLVLLAGCLGGAEPEASTSETGSQTASPDTQPEATSEVKPSENATGSSGNVPVGTPVSYSGKAPVGVCQFIAGQCQFVVAGSEDYHMLDVQGHATHLALQVTYSGQAPGMDFYVGVCVGEDDGSDCLDYLTGPSPLVVEFDLSSYPAGTQFGISIGSLNTAAEPAATYVFGPADFEVVGTLTTLPAA